MKKRTVPRKSNAIDKPKKYKAPLSREYIHSLRGKYRGQGLMKDLMAEKKRWLAFSCVSRTGPTRYRRWF